MCKSCDNCYWKHEKKKAKWCVYQKEKPIIKICKMHDFICKGCEMDIATLEYNNKKLCFKCLQSELELETSTETTFYHEGVCLGTDEKMEEVYKSLNEIGINVKEIEE